MSEKLARNDIDNLGETRTARNRSVFRLQMQLWRCDSTRSGTIEANQSPKRRFRPNRIFIYTQYYVPTFIGTLQFYGTIAAAISTAIGWGCEVSGGCGPQPVDPGPGPFEPDGPPPVEPGGAGAQH